jgi:hypothetical protein
MSPFDSPLQNWFLITQEVFILKGLKSKIGFNSLTFIWMKKKQLAMIPMVLNGKHKYFSNFDSFSLWSNALFGSLGSNYTPLPFVQMSPMFINVLKDICVSVGYYWSSITCEILRMKKVWYLLIWMYDHPNILILHTVKNTMQFFQKSKYIVHNFHP